MAKNDWAIVVGIQRYLDPDLSGLQGADNDAKEFYDWVISSDGGAVPPGQATLIRSSDFPPFTTAAGAMPTRTALKKAFDHLLTLADENAAKDLGRTVGDRLYVFFSGHGFTPYKHLDLTALLTAEASVAEAKLMHLVGSYMADRFWSAKLFKETILFMDCCRTLMHCAQPYNPYEEELATDFHEGRRFYAYGARVAKESREWQMADGGYHGVFTRTLLNALGGAGHEPNDPSKITAESLRNYLYTSFKNFMSEADRLRPDLPKYPEVVYEQIPGVNFTIVTRGNVVGRLLRRTKGATYDVTIVASPPRLGQRATVRNKTLSVVADQPLTVRTTLQLPPGLYSIEFPGSGDHTPFEVAGVGVEVNV